MSIHSGNVSPKESPVLIGYNMEWRLDDIKSNRVLRI